MSEVPHRDFRQGNKADLRRILRAVSENESESQTIDFKQNADRSGALPRLLDSNRENLGKLISAFANTSGGVIVWGVESKDGRANRVDPIPNISAFVQQLNTHTGGITDPPVTGVETFGVEQRGTGKGYAVTFVPESNRKPHQCVASNRTRNYWMRVGSNVEQMPHSFVRAQMLERQRPQLRLVGCYPRIFALKDGSLFSMQRMGLFNCGDAIAKHVAVTVDARPGEVELIKQPLVGVETDVAVWDDYESMDSRRPGKLFGLRPEVALYNGTEVDVFTVRLRFGTLDKVRFLQLTCLLSCDGFSGISQLQWSKEDFQHPPEKVFDDYPTSLGPIVEWAKRDR